MNRVLSVLLVLAAPQMSLCQEEDIKKALAGCAALDIDAARLDCFEQLARAVAQIPAEPPEAPVSKFKGSPGPGKWKVEVSTNPVDDSKTVALGLVDPSDSMQLVLLCQQGKPRAYVTTGKYLGAKSTRVLTRIGEAKAESKDWPLSMNQKAAVYPGDAGPFIRRLATVERLVVQVSPLAENPVTAVFNLGGLPNVVAPLKETCRLP